MFPDVVGGFASAGLAAVEGHPASRFSAAFVAGRGGDLAAHRAQPVTRGLLADASWVIGMTRSHAAIFRSRWREVYGGSIGLLGAPGSDLAGTVHSPAVAEVDDPYGRDEAAYIACGERIAHMLEGWRETFTALNRKDTP